MSSSTSSAPVVVDWALLGDQVTTTQQRIEQTKESLSPAGSQQFVDLFLAFTWHNPPSVAEAQSSLRLILSENESLLSQYASFLNHPNDTPAACEAARDEFGRILGMPMFSLKPPTPGWTCDDLLAAIEAGYGTQIVDQFASIYSDGLRNLELGKPTRPLLLELVKDDKDLLDRFNRLWPIENGDVW
ncbi:hypothetical protein DL95DRAFT_393519 [Leptodontidium sp. 2 PMI_412]|nr:hypothetical protein DL95DRAFT_393519 [Leptodontidium sp. 2 PMI_412]